MMTSRRSFLAGAGAAALATTLAACSQDVPSVPTATGTSTPLYCAGSLSKAGAESFWLFDLFGDSLNARRGAWINARFVLRD